MGRELLSSISSSCYHTTLQTGLLTKRHLFLTILEAGRLWLTWCLGREPTTWFRDGCLSPLSSPGGRDENSLGSLLLGQ